MTIKLKNGIDKLLFGMKKSDVTAIYGQPDSIFKDEDLNDIFVFNSKKMRLTFYKDEDYNLGYIIGSSLDLVLFGENIIGQSIELVQQSLHKNQITKFAVEDFDTCKTFFNEDNWFILQTEFGEVTKFEIGALINDDDTFEWKFKK